jgi:hypothetical protein
MRSLAKFNRMLSYQRRPCPHLFGIGAAMDWSRRLRRRINPAKQSSNRGEILPEPAKAGTEQTGS